MSAVAAKKKKVVKGKVDAFPRYAKYKDSGVEWLGEIPEEWNIENIRAVTELKSEKNSPDEEVLSVYREYGVILKNSRDDNHNATSLETGSYKFVKLCQELCKTLVEEKYLVDAFARLNEAIPEAEPDKAPKIDPSQLERAERYLERRTQAISFKRSIEDELKDAKIGFHKDYCEGIYSTDYLIQFPHCRIALECKFNVHRDFDKSLATVKILKEKLACDKSVIVVPYSDTQLNPNITESLSVTVLQASNLISTLVSWRKGK